MDIILLVSICRSFCIRSSGMLACIRAYLVRCRSLSQWAHVYMLALWVRIHGCLRVCDVHVCVLCVLYLPPSEALVTALQQVYPVAVLRARGRFAPIAKSSPREAPQCPLNFTCLFAYLL